jgi:predicted ArsR family transcriptional regulator
MFRNMPFENAEQVEKIPTRKLSDPRAMRAMAHPTRLELMELLGREGQLTATRAGELMGLSPANCSFHLRQLAKYGFVEEAGAGAGRNRPWRLVSLSHEWSESELDDEGSAAASALSMVVLEREMERLAGWFERQRDEPVEWSRAATSSSAIVYLTLDELQELTDSLQELTARHLARMSDPTLRPPGARPVSFISAAYPLVATPSGG